MALAIDGLLSSSTGGTTLTVGAGSCRDSNDTVDIVIPAGQTRTVNTAVQGPGGIIGGTVAPNTSYALYIGRNSATGDVICALSTDFSTPVTPGYALRRIGAALTNQSSQIVAFTQTGTSNERTTTYDASPPVLVVVNGLSAGSLQPFVMGPPRPVTAHTARLQVVPTAGPTTLSSSPATLEISLSSQTTLGFRPPIGSDKGSFMTASSATTTIRVTGYVETV